jgi:hypothetical protein
VNRRINFTTLAEFIFLRNVKSLRGTKQSHLPDQALHLIVSTIASFLAKTKKQETISSYKNDCPSPDSSDILFLAPLARKRYSG